MFCGLKSSQNSLYIQKIFFVLAKLYQYQLKDNLTQGKHRISHIWMNIHRKYSWSKVGIRIIFLASRTVNYSSFPSGFGTDADYKQEEKWNYSLKCAKWEEWDEKKLYSYSKCQTINCFMNMNCLSCSTFCAACFCGRLLEWAIVAESLALPHFLNYTMDGINFNLLQLIFWCSLGQEHQLGNISKVELWG